MHLCTDMSYENTGKAYPQKYATPAARFSAWATVGQELLLNCVEPEKHVSACARVRVRVRVRACHCGPLYLCASVSLCLRTYTYEYIIIYMYYVECERFLLAQDYCKAKVDQGRDKEEQHK